MGKALELKRKILKLLPQVLSTVHFATNELTSPRISTSSAGGRGSISPRPIMISIIPAEARRKPKNASFEAKEPTSPKVSCFGQVNNKNNKKSKAKNKPPPPPPRQTLQISCPKGAGKKSKSKPKSPSMFTFHEGHENGGGKNHGVVDHRPVSPQSVPSLGRMTQFSRGIDGCKEDEEEAIVSFSAPIAAKEINLWKRRDIAPPAPLQLWHYTSP